MGGLGGAGLAGGAGAEGEAADVESDEEGFGVDAGEGEAGGVGQAGLGRAVDGGTGEGGEEGLLEAVAKGGEGGGAVAGILGGGVEPGGGEAGGVAEADDAGDVLSAGAALTLMRTAEVHGAEGEAAADEEGADAFGAVHLVGGEAEEIDAEGEDIDGDLADGLNGVGVDEGAGGMGEAGELGDGLEDAGLVVGEHEADECLMGAGVWGEGARERLGRDAAGGGDGKEGEVDAVVLKGFGRVKDGVVLDGGGDEVRAGRAGGAGGGGEREEDAGEGVVVALGAAGGEDDLGGAGVEEGGDGVAGSLDGGLGVLSVLVDGARVAEVLEEEGMHGLEDVRGEGRGAVRVEVDAVHSVSLRRWHACWRGRAATGLMRAGRESAIVVTVPRRLTMMRMVSGERGFGCWTGCWMRAAVLGGVVALSMGAAVPVLAQSGATEQNGSVELSKVLDKMVGGVEDEMMGVARAMPAEKFDFAPTQAIFVPSQKTEFAGVRTFAQECIHVAQANYYFFGQAGGTKPSVDVKSLSSLKTKDEVVKALAASFAFAHEAVATISTDNAMNPVRDGETRATIATAGVAHAFDHYGQMVVYLRMNGQVPPASKK